DRLLQRTTAVLAERLDRDRHLVRGGPRTLHRRRHQARRQVDRQHLTGPGVAAPPGEPPPVADTLQDVDEPPRPPRRPDRAPPRPGAQAALHPDRRPVPHPRSRSHLRPPPATSAGTPRAAPAWT